MKRFRIKIEPYFVTYRDTWLLGPTASIDTREFRFGIGFAFCEIGVCFKSEKPFGYGCSGCGKIGEALVDHLPEGWAKRFRRNSTYYFLCPECIAKRKRKG